MKVGIIGATGYSGEWLVRLLSRHPQAELALVASRSQIGKTLDEVMPGVAGPKRELKFVSSEVHELAANEEVTHYFLALPHGVAAEYALPLVEAGKTVIDLSADFRLDSPELYATYYGAEHPAKEWLPRVPYVLPEIAEDRGDDWRASQLLACPGCYPTSVQLPLYPLLKDKLISPEGLIINSLSGVSGAGRKATEFFSFSERQGSVLAYGAPNHRHTAEIEEQLADFAGTDVLVQFTPHLIPVHAGIQTTIVGQAQGSIDALYDAWQSVYGESAFVDVLPSGTFPETKHVVGSNHCRMSAVFDPRTKRFVITSVIDNLIKGASGQAIQILNLLAGWPEDEGLK
jgi:N-acetyl-gamma-glutamyl-phosphate reductase|tara:strand:+ start:10511 stop:11542 length:1032 start_codon:yes stop_codon:yes gene_type:complete